MKLFFDFFPILVFFLTYKFFGIYVATGIAIATSFAQLLFYWLKFHRIETMTLISCVIITILGGFTLFLHNDLFIKWKPTVIYLAFALAFLFSGFFSSQSLLQRMLGSSLKLSSAIWKRLNYIWVGFFILISGLNLYVAYHFSTNTWVYFKLFGIIGLTLIFLLAQGVYISKFVEADHNIKSQE